MLGKVLKNKIIKKNNKPTVFLTSPYVPRVKPLSSGSCVCDEEFPILFLCSVYDFFLT